MRALFSACEPKQSPLIVFSRATLVWMESRRAWWPYGVLAAEVLAFYRLVLFVPGYVIPWDIQDYHLPLATFIANSLRRGELPRSEEHTSELQSHVNLVCRLLLEK